MTDTSRTPERILATKRRLDGRRAWYSEEIAVPSKHEIVAPYIRENISQAHVAVAYEAAAYEVAEHAKHVAKERDDEWRASQARTIAKGILALTPADAKAALNRLIREAEERGFWAGRSCGGAKAEIDAALAAIRSRGKGDE